MKKTTFSLCTVLLTSSLIVNTGFAQTGETTVSNEVSEETPASSETLEKVEELANESESFDVISLDELPEGTPLLYFDTMEDFEKAIKELEEEQQTSETLETADVVESQGLPLSSFAQKTSNFSVQSDSLATAEVSAAAAAKTTVTRQRVMWSATINPILTQVRPLYVTVDMKYTYTGTGSTRKFKNISSIKSTSPLTFPHDWKQTDFTKSFYNTNKAVTVKLIGHHLIGFSIGGQGVGARVSDTLKYKTPIGSTATVKQVK